MRRLYGTAYYYACVNDESDIRVELVPMPKKHGVAQEMCAATTKEALQEACLNFLEGWSRGFDL